MRAIKRSTLLNEYGIDLPVGKFKVIPVGDKYVINSVQDDTEGCPLIGEERTENGVRKCKEVVDGLVRKVIAEEKLGNLFCVTVK